MPASPKFAVLGEALVDLIPSEQGVAVHPGGSPYNVAIGLARLDRPTALLARLSGDEYGAVLRAHALESGVDLSHAVDADEPSTTARVRLDHGSADYDFRVEGTADFCWAIAELKLPTGTSFLHFGSLASWLAPADEVVDSFVAGLSSVLVSYDPNVRPMLQRDRAAARAAVERSVRHAHVVKASVEDLAWLYRETDPSDAARHWLSLGASLVVVSRGDEGVTAYRSSDEPLSRPAQRVAVVDTVGAGDALTSGLLDGLARRDVRTPADLAELASSDRLAEVLDHAGLVAARTCARPGADPPYARELTGQP